MINIRAGFAAALGFVQLVGAPTTLRADGDDFFEAAGIPGETEYAVAGTVKDVAGRYLNNVTVTIETSDPHLSYDAITDALGRFRTLDIGRLIKELGYDVDSSKVTVEPRLPGYRTVRRFNRGKARQNKGVVEMDFTLAKN